jgi:hypothetical protein
LEEEEDKEDKNTEPVRADFEDFIVAKQIKISVCQTEDRIIGYPTTGNKNINHWSCHHWWIMIFIKYYPW